MDDALKAQIVGAIHYNFITEKSHKYTGFLGVSTRDLLDHLLERYRKITAANIEECKNKMNQPMDSTQSIDTFFRRIDDCVQYAIDRKVAFTNEQILQTAYHAIASSGYYTDATKVWRKKAKDQKTWANFKKCFATKYHDLQEQKRINNTQTNFHGANSTIDWSSTLNNLALAATTDKDIVAQLTLGNQQLIAANKNLTEQLKTAI
jgi:hypothetical protein